MAPETMIAVAVIAAVPPTLAVAVSWWSARQADKRRALEVNAQLYSIHALTNSRLTAALERIETQTEEIRALKEHVIKGLK